MFLSSFRLTLTILVLETHPPLLSASNRHILTPFWLVNNLLPPHVHQNSIFRSKPSSSLNLLHGVFPDVNLEPELASTDLPE